MRDFTSFVLAQTSTTTNFSLDNLLKPDGIVFQLVFAIAILVGGWVVAIFFSSMTEGLLKRTDIDNKLANWLTGSRSSSLPIEKWAGTTVFWIILLFTLVGFFQFLRLDAVATPLNSLLAQVASFLPKLGGAAILAGIAWILATISKAIVGRFLRTAQIDTKVNESVGDTTTQVMPLSETL
jgi:hypothetical protein